MIYEMISDCLQSTENRWRNLSGAFQRLAESLPATNRFRDVIGNFQKDCLNEKDRIGRQRPKMRGFQQPVALFKAAINDLGISETECSRIETFFNTLTSRLLDESTAIGECREQLKELQEFITQCLQEFQEVISAAVSDEGKGFYVKRISEATGDISQSTDDISEATDNLASYPILTSELSLPSPLLPGRSGGAGSVSWQRTIDDALREVLGRLPKPSDPRSFVAALNQSFQSVEVEGRTELTWTPGSYLGQSELGGGVTGAQASLYTRAQSALNNSLPLLDRLYPLLTTADKEEVDAARAIVRSQLTEVVNELAREGGPRIRRVNTLFALLLDDDTTPPGGGKPIPGGKLGYLENVFGLKSDQVNNLEEEENVTNFRILRDYVDSLQKSWENFEGRGEIGQDLGTGLVLLSRALSVVAETVDEVYAAMDSVFVGPAERQVAFFKINNESVLVEELLSWVVTFASEEAQRLVNEGGRRGVETIIPTTQQLKELVEGFLNSIEDEQPSLPVGLRHPRVRNPLSELKVYLQQVEDLAQKVKQPPVQQS